MSDFVALRRHMVDGQLRTSDVTDIRVLAAMLDVPRERFVPASFAAVAYLDIDLPAGEGADMAARRLPKPQLLGKVLQAAAIADNDNVLVVGSNTGYSAAVIAHLAKSVVALEENTVLVTRAREALSGIANVTQVQGELVKGWPSAGPYDVIVFDGATEIEPHGLCGQLRDGGRLMCVLSNGPGGKAMIYRRSGTSTAGRQVFDAVAPVLPGFTRREAFAF